MKVSVVMQSYLKDYPGSRSNPKEKFVRAVNSFLAQKHKDKELIIIADRCQITMDIYNSFYKDASEVKCFFYEDDETRRMYEGFWRGKPKAFGVEQATGEIISYLDSDDIILPHHLSNINQYFEDLYKGGNEHVVWASNALRFFNVKALSSDKMPDTYIHNYLNLRNFYFYDYGISEEFFLNLSVPDGFVSGVTYALFHRRDIKTKWEDAPKQEDLYFLERMQREHGGGIRVMSPTYILGHYRGVWDS